MLIPCLGITLATTYKNKENDMKRDNDYIRELLFEFEIRNGLSMIVHRRDAGPVAKNGTMSNLCMMQDTLQKKAMKYIG